MRLIDAKEAEKMADKIFGKDTVSQIIAKKLIRATPTIDAVPVVRCGECREYRDGDCYHPLGYGMGDMLRGLEPTDFCSYGERKE